LEQSIIQDQRHHYRRRPLIPFDEDSQTEVSAASFQPQSELGHVVDVKPCKPAVAGLTHGSQFVAHEKLLVSFCFVHFPPVRY
jgi:hypothetical protein